MLEEDDSPIAVSGAWSLYVRIATFVTSNFIVDQMDSFNLK